MQVLLDRDLAEMYHVEVKQLNRQVKRNINRFRVDFMFQLTREEFNSLKCHFGASNTRGGETGELCRTPLPSKAFRCQIETDHQIEDLFNERSDSRRTYL